MGTGRSCGESNQTGQVALPLLLRDSRGPDFFRPGAPEAPWPLLEMHPQFALSVTRSSVAGLLRGAALGLCQPALGRGQRWAAVTPPPGLQEKPMHAPGSDPASPLSETDQGARSLLFMMFLFLPCMSCPIWLVKNGHQPGEVGREEDFQTRSMVWLQQENLGSFLGGGLAGLVRRAAERVRDPCQAFVSASVLHEALGSWSGPDVLTLQKCGNGLKP